MNCSQSKSAMRRSLFVVVVRSAFFSGSNGMPLTMDLVHADLKGHRSRRSSHADRERPAYHDDAPDIRRRDARIREASGDSCVPRSHVRIVSVMEAEGRALRSLKQYATPLDERVGRDFAGAPDEWSQVVAVTSQKAGDTRLLVGSPRELARRRQPHSLSRGADVGEQLPLTFEILVRDDHCLLINDEAIPIDLVPGDLVQQLLGVDDGARSEQQLCLGWRRVPEGR